MFFGYIEKKSLKKTIFTEAKKATATLSAMTITSQTTKVVVDLSKQETKII